MTSPRAELSQEQGEAGSQGPGKGAIMGRECTVTQDTKGGKDQVDCKRVKVSAAQQGVEHK